ncbi:MAG: SoxR reducing system RseC family protein [Clostridia bacterium]|jgi:sigma-E factor negative regulatory protein RseC|nr:SoxR reducing system RseC family protein [Clostridia bacterium]
MMIEKARVISVNGQKAKVQIKRTGACGESCAGCKGGCAQINTYVEAVNTVRAVSGQEVEIEMSTKVFMNAIILNYVLPLIMLILGIFAGSAMVDGWNLSISGDLLGILLGFGLMAISYTLVYFIDKHYKKNGKVRFIIKRVC